MTTEVSATTEPRRRRWLLWTAVGLVSIALGTAIGLALLDVLDIRRANALRIGQSDEQVVEIMGLPWIENPAGDTIFWGRRPAMLSVLARRIRLTYRIRDEDWPVAIRFDSSRRVDRIKRGSEIVERNVQYQFRDDPPPSESN